MEAALHTPQLQNYIYSFLFDQTHSNFYPQKKVTTELKEFKYDGLCVSEEEYWSKYYELSDIALEWNNGILEEKPVADRESFELYSWFFKLIMYYFDTFKEGILIGLEIGFKLVVEGETKIRKPDLAFIHKDNPVQMPPFDTSYKGCFDICFEFLSDTNKKAVERDTVIKRHEYEKYGVKEYYILDRLGNETAFYYLNSKGTYKRLKPNKEGIIKSRILKNFQFREEDLYNLPDFKSLTNDSVYSKYVMQDYQKEHKKYEAEKKRADSLEKELMELKKILEAKQSSIDFQ
ncbi:protein containing DUF820 [Candidatus Magnetomorum sp. HK-1]|nr:protein containing DUF820 [Candidatus Magnetomorum sp. HK-1]